MMAATVLSKLLGMLRSVLLARHYGTTWRTDAFTTASRIPLAVFDIFLSAAILGCFIPVYNSFKSTDKSRDSEADRFALIFFNTIALFTGILTLVGIVFARPIVSVIGIGLSDTASKLAVDLLRIMFPMIIFTGTAFTLVGVMQSKGNFILPAMISAISNAAVIIYFLFVDDCLGEYGIYGLAFAYLIAWFIQLVTLAVPLRRSGFKFSFLLDFKDSNLRRAMKSLPPIMIGSWLSPIGIVIGTSFSTLLGDGYASVFDYANNIYVIIVGILVYSICNYIFPALSKLNGTENEQEFNSVVSDGLASAFMILVPFMAAVFVLGGEGVSVLYQGNEFTAQSAEMTADALKIMCIGMPAYALIELGTRVFYARGITSVPMVSALCGVAVDVIFSFILLYSGVGELIGVGAFTFAFAVGQWAAALCIGVMLIRNVKGAFDGKFIAKLIKILISGGMSYAVMRVLYELIDHNPYASNKITNIAVAIIIFVAGATVYILPIYFTILREKNNGK